MDKVIESFISQCDEMMIAEEGFISKIKEKKNSIDLHKKDASTRVSYYINKKEYYMSKEDATTFINKLNTAGNYSTNNMNGSSFLNAIYVLDLSIKDIKKITDKEAPSTKKSYSEYFNCDEAYEKMQSGSPNADMDKIDKELATMDFRTISEDGGGNTLVYSAGDGHFYDLDHEKTYTENLKNPISFKELKTALKEIYTK